jgi:imidazolonepropionase
MSFDTVWTNGRLWTGRVGKMGIPDQIVDRGCVACTAGKISFVGRSEVLPTPIDAKRIIDVEGRLVTPGLIDCHTHVVYAGHRADEWRMRLEGCPYQQIARSGGGIASTVRKVRQASEEELFIQSARRLEALKADGVTTVEIKSGYGLDAENEAKMLRVARRLGQQCDVSVSTTFLGAHAVPPECSDKDAYIDDVITRQLPRIHGEGLIDSVDAFVEGIGFSVDQVRRVFDAAKRLGIPVKVHAEQMSLLGGAQMAASEFHALSADHLEYLDDEGVSALARAGTVAVLLPGAFYFLKETQKPPVDDLRRAGVPLAVATDCNPGSSPMSSLLLAMNMACTLFGLTPDEALLGVTIHAARALRLDHEIGSLEIGKRCDLAIWDVETPAELAYHLGVRPLFRRVWRGNG